MKYHLFDHFKKVLTHKKYVFEICCKLGIPFTGLLHDMSKFSPVEFFEGAKYYSGDRSPNENARKEKGYSIAWCHHTNCNPSHFDYWLDFQSKDKIVPIPMPNKRIKENLADRIGAYKAYHPNDFDYSKPLEYFITTKHTDTIHPETEEKIIHCLTLISEKGEKSFKEIKKYLRR